MIYPIYTINALFQLRRVARISQWGGRAFLEAWNNSKRTWQKFHQSWIRLRRFFCQNQVISNKKDRSSSKFSHFSWLGKHQNKNSTFLIQITANLLQLLLPNPVGGAVFIFRAKIGLKNTKNVPFWILFRSMEGYTPPGYATVSACVFTIHSHEQHGKNINKKLDPWQKVS